MRVLFVYRGYGPLLRNSVVDAQVNSLESAGVEIDRFILSTGGKGYLKAYWQLKKHLKTTMYDVVHAHYGLCGILAGLANKGVTVVSLMGSDILGQKKWLVKMTTFFAHRQWNKTIVKSNNLLAVIPGAILIPNGINLDLFKPIARQQAQEKVLFDPTLKHIIFVAESPHSDVKNLALAQAAIQLIQDTKVELHVVSKVTQDELVDYYNAADLLLLTSKSEGSPNVIKEAMACNCPVVSTDVGDVRERFNGAEGHFLSASHAGDVADKIQLALSYNRRTNGRDHLADIDNKFIAERIIAVYGKSMELIKHE